MYSEYYIRNGKLLKSKKHFYICLKCGLNMVCPADESYTYNLCWICFLKSKGYYKSAMNAVKTGWFVWSTHISDEKMGWSFAQSVLISFLLCGIMNDKNLNKTPKVPQMLQSTLEQKLKFLGITKWQYNITKKIYPNCKL